jgi:hypothetical protein
MNTAKNIEPREGARPVGVRHRRPKGRGRTDAQTRVSRCLAMVWCGGTVRSRTARGGRSEVATKLQS